MTKTHYVKKETRNYDFTDRFGRPATLPVTYSLSFVDGILREVFNEFGNSIEKDSECWQYFSSTYNK